MVSSKFVLVLALDIIDALFLLAEWIFPMSSIKIQNQLILELAFFVHHQIKVLCNLNWLAHLRNIQSETTLYRLRTHLFCVIFCILLTCDFMCIVVFFFIFNYFFPCVYPDSGCNFCPLTNIDFGNKYLKLE